MKELKFHPNEVKEFTNELLRIDDKNYMSFNAEPCKDIGIFRADNDSCETALFYEGQWIIANADLRKEIEVVVPDLNAVFEVFNKAFREGKKSTWSTAIDERDAAESLLSLLSKVSK